MKKYTFTFISLTIAALFVFAACDTNTKEAEKKKGGIVIGNIAEGNDAKAELTISLDTAAGLMQKHNRLEEEWFNYTYTSAWIEIIQTEENKFSYYLAVEASLEGKNNEQAYSCYSVYTELTAYNNELNFYPDAFQQSCRGKCCDKCKLTLFDNNSIGCECETPSDEPKCNGEGRCNHSTSVIIDEEQEKDDLI